MSSEFLTIQKLTEEEKLELYQRVFNTDDGRLVLEDLRQRSFGYLTTINEGGNDILAVGAREGRRQVVLHIETMLRIKPEDLKQEDSDV